MLYVARCKHTGFTLIEIMIVIAIIAILAGIAIPNIMMARFEAGLTACQENCRVGMEAVQMALVRRTLQQLCEACEGLFYDGDGMYAPEIYMQLEHLVDLGYLEKPLRCPVGNSGYNFVKLNFAFGFACTPTWSSSFAHEHPMFVTCLYNHVAGGPGYYGGLECTSQLFPAYVDGAGPCLSEFDGNF